MTKRLIELATKEERLARRFLELRGLVPRIEVYDLAREVAILSEKRFPAGVDVDGLCLDLKIPGVRPKIWLNAKSNYHRKRFTLAHEVGHVVIPWHLGNIVDDLAAGTATHESRYRRLEAEANRFATEILMPKEWAHRICHTSDHLRGAMISIASVADVSSHAAALRVTQVGPAGYLVAAVRDGRIEWSEKTRGTAGHPPSLGTHLTDLDMPSYFPPEICDVGSSKYYWWKVRDTVEVPPKPDGTWREVLEYILLSIGEERRTSVRQTINAIVGYHIGRFPRGTEPAILYRAVLLGLQNRTDRNKEIPIVRRHPSFRDYILLRIYDRSEGQPNGR